METGDSDKRCSALWGVKADSWTVIGASRGSVGPELVYTPRDQVLILLPHLVQLQIECLPSDLRRTTLNRPLVQLLPHINAPNLIDLIIKDHDFSTIHYLTCQQSMRTQDQWVPKSVRWKCPCGPKTRERVRRPFCSI